MQRGLHPAEERFARYALVALAPGVASEKEKQAAARDILEMSLRSLPQSRSGELFAAEIERRFPGCFPCYNSGHTRAICSANIPELEIEAALLIANLASLLIASADQRHVQEAEKCLQQREGELLQLATVSGQAPALPLAIADGLFRLYYMERELGGICIHSLPGEGQGLPIVFVGEERGSRIEEDTVLRTACHEMIHSSQRAGAEEVVPGWPLNARVALLEAITEGLAVCRIGKKEHFLAEELPRREYAYFVVALFTKMRRAGVPLERFPDTLEELNNSLFLAADMVGTAEEFIGEATKHWKSLTLQEMRVLCAKEAESAKEAEALRYIGEFLSSGEDGLGIVSKVLSA